MHLTPAFHPTPSHLTSPSSISLYKGVRMSIETLLLTIESVTIEQNPSAQSDQLIELWYLTQTVIKRNPVEWNATLWKDGLEMSTTNCLEKLQREERVVRSISVSGSRQIFDFVPEITLQSKECIQSPILYCIRFSNTLFPFSTYSTILIINKFVLFEPRSRLRSGLKKIPFNYTFNNFILQ